MSAMRLVAALALQEMKKMRDKKEKIYALYRGDKYLYEGTKLKLAKKLGVSVRTISFYGSPTYQKRTKNGYALIEVEG